MTALRYPVPPDALAAILELDVNNTQKCRYQFELKSNLIFTNSEECDWNWRAAECGALGDLGQGKRNVPGAFRNRSGVKSLWFRSLMFSEEKSFNREWTLIDANEERNKSWEEG
jgi:hypothetical protein